ncbi:hypothetical protein MUP79_08305 [Candidatus Bathyarchaeota archaeon]|nr:hypothetical protein [Candidatus Bathyarchaeota archaeon]
MFSVATKTEMAAGLRILFEQKRITLPNDKKLIIQINSLRYQVSKTGNLLFESPEKEGVHDDYLWALALACYAARETPLVVKSLFGEHSRASASSRTRIKLAIMRRNLYSHGDSPVWSSGLWIISHASRWKSRKP